MNAVFKYLIPMRHMVTISAALLAVGCADASEKVALTYGAQIGIVNHTDRYIYATSVNGQAGGHAHKYNPGVANMCCIVLPEKWHPGLKLLVEWDMPEGTKHVWREKIVTVEEYSSPGSLYLHFFPNDQVRIVVTKWAGGSRRHPIAPPAAPNVNDEDQ